MFYKIDSTRVTLHEYWWGKKSLQSLLNAGICKLFKIQATTSLDDPNVESMQPFEVAEDALPQPVREAFAPMMQSMAELGFHSPVFHALVDAFHLTSIYHATFIHQSGQAIGRVHYRVWTAPHPTRTSLFAMFISAFNDGTFLISTGAPPDMHAPRTCKVNRMMGANPASLWALHQLRFAEESKSYYPIQDRNSLLWLIEAYHAEVRDFHLKRGVFKPMTAEETEKASSQQAFLQGTAGNPPLLHAEVLSELNQMQKKQAAGWGRIVLILVVSLAAFVGLGASQWAWDYVLLLVPILLFHELGHYLAMRIFKYKNLQMFFIPFLGAAVSGRNYNVSGWKKVVVSLMGPVPGIFVGVVLGVAGMLLHKALLIKAAKLMLIINGFNLLPILPLDGGWVMHALFFSRHSLLDVGFRVVAAIAMLVASVLLQTKGLMYVGIATLAALPASYKLAKIVDLMRAQGISSASPDDQNIPTATAQSIITEVKKAFPKGATTKTIATHTLQVFQTLNARPPGWPVSILFVGVHGFSILLAVVFAAVFLVSQSGDFGKLLATARFMPKQPYQCGSVQVWKGQEADMLKHGQNTLVASFKNHAEAEKAFTNIRTEAPGKAAMETFGQTLLLSLPNDDEALRKAWFGKLLNQTTNVFVNSTNFHAAFSLMCIAGTEEEAKAIEKETREYFQLAGMFVAPPWLEINSWSPEQKSQHELARKTYGKLQNTSYDFLKDNGWKELQKKVRAAQRQGDTAEITRLTKEQKDLLKNYNQKQLDELRGLGGKLVDIKLIDLYTNLPESYTNKLRKEIMLQMGERMGQLPLADGKLTPDAEKYAVRFGTVSRNGLILHFSYVSFYRTFDGMPKLTDWLCSKGCVEFKYEISGEPAYEGEENLMD